jgi:rod shape-determining protein MreB
MPFAIGVAAPLAGRLAERTGAQPLIPCVATARSARTSRHRSSSHALAPAVLATSSNRYPAAGRGAACLALRCLPGRRPDGSAPRFWQSVVMLLRRHRRRTLPRVSLPRGLGGCDMAIDLGTANTLVYVEGRGIVVSEASVVAMDTRSGRVHAVGADAQRMIGRTPATITATRPLRHGVIADFEVTEAMLRHFMGRVLARSRARPHVIVCAPSGITDVEERALQEASLAAGARRVRLIEEPIAAAIGAGLQIAEPLGRLVVDVGGGTSEMAVISLGGIVLFRSVRVGGYELDDAIARYLRACHSLAVGQQTAEAIKIAIGSAVSQESEEVWEVRGRHLTSGLPTEVRLHGAEVREAIEGPLQEIVGAIKDTLEHTPPELTGDIAREGILLAGGGTLLRGFPELVAAETDLPVVRAESPLTCVVMGSGQALAHFDRLGAACGRRHVSRTRVPASRG